MDSNTKDSGISFLGLLQVMFIGLKLAGCVSWSWLWVLAPAWISLCLFVIFVLIALINDI